MPACEYAEPVKRWISATDASVGVEQAGET
jgi:hypothetical protein